MSSIIFNAKLDEWELKLLDISDSFAAALAKHEFLNQDGAIINHLGNKPREIKFRAYFFGSEQTTVDINTALAGLTQPSDIIAATAANYFNHYDFLESMNYGQDTGEAHRVHTLVHPKYGTIKGFIETLVVNHDDTINFVAIDIGFVQKDIQNAFMPVESDVQKINQLNTLLINAEIDKMNAGMLSSGFGAMLNTVIETGKSIEQTFSTATLPVKNFAKGCDNFITAMSTFAHDVTQPLDSVNSALNFVGDVPSLLGQAVVSATNRIVTSLSNISNLPLQFTNNCILQYQAMKNIVTGKNANFFQVHLLNICAGSLTTTGTELFVADENNRTKAVAQESQQSFDLNGNKINTITPVEVMSVQEVEAMLFQIRSFTQDTIVSNRANALDSTQLAEMAARLTSYIDQIKLNKLNQKTITVNNIPLHLLCMQLGLNYNAADRILKQNPNIKNPTFTEGEITVYVQ